MGLPFCHLFFRLESVPWRLRRNAIRDGRMVRPSVVRVILGTPNA